MRIAFVVMLAACGGPRFLGERLPPACHESYAACDAAIQLRGWEDGYLEDTRLDAYVTKVEARIARASVLDYMPEVVIAPVGAAEIIGRSIVIGRSTIVALGSEAELAGLLAHETAHLEAGLDATSYLGSPVDEESLADERGVVLLARAGYPSLAMAGALSRILGPEDDQFHPAREFRIRRTTLAATDTNPDTTRAALLEHVDGVIVGRALETGVLVRDAWVVADRDIAIRLPAGMTFDNADSHASSYTGLIRYGAWRIGSRTAHDLAGRLDVHVVLELPIGHVTIGVARPKPEPVLGSLALLLERRRSELGDVYGSELAAVIENPHGAMVVSLTGGITDDAVLRRWLTLMHPLTAAERGVAVSPRVKLVRAPKTATVRELVASCIDPAAALELDDPDRVIAQGEPLKCTTSKSITSTWPAQPPNPPKS